MRTVLLALSLSMGCAGEMAAVEPPVLCKLQARDRTLTVYAAGAPLRFSVQDSHGRWLLSGGDLDELRTREPGLYRLYRAAMANGGQPVLIAR
jgi:hypothetical protein